MAIDVVDSDAVTVERPGAQVQHPAKVATPDMSRETARRAAGVERLNLKCANCGQKARVHILDAYKHGEPVYRRLCLGCAGRLPAERPGLISRLSTPALLAGAGLTLGLLALFVDGMLPESEPSYGWAQRAGVLAGALLLIVGTMRQLEILAVLGGVLFCGALIQDWGDLRGALGANWKQQICVAAASFCVFCGMASWLSGTTLLARLRRAVMSPRWTGYEAAARVGPEK
jgi:hypothetical protein